MRSYSVTVSPGEQYCVVHIPELGEVLKVTDMNNVEAEAKAFISRQLGVPESEVGVKDITIEPDDDAGDVVDPR